MVILRPHRGRLALCVPYPGSRGRPRANFCDPCRGRCPELSGAPGDTVDVTLITPLQGLPALLHAGTRGDAPGYGTVAPLGLGLLTTWARGLDGSVRVDRVGTPPLQSGRFLILTSTGGDGGTDLTHATKRPTPHPSRMASL